MHSHIIFIVICTIVAVQADLSCLGWGVISPVVGLFCYFEPKYFKATESKAVTVVKEAVQDAENLVKFDLTHNPAVVTYNFIEQTNKGGIGQGGQYLKGVAQDFEDVTIGFGKGTANQVIRILQIANWNAVSLCILEGATNLALQQQKVKRMSSYGTSAPARGHHISPTNNTALMTQPQANQANAMANACIDKLKQHEEPATFHLNNTNQKVGSTISDIAAFLIPIGGEEKVAAGVIEGPVDLAIPGSESSTRVVKMVSENTGDHFTNEAEAQSVADKMKEKSWVQDNCGICGNSPAPLSSLISMKRLNRRVKSMASCCRLPTIPEGHPGPIDVEIGAKEDPIPEPKRRTQIGEASLVPAPELPARNLKSISDRYALLSDLNRLSTGLITWSPELAGVMGSDELFSTLREAFTDTSSPLYRAMDVRMRDSGFRIQSCSSDWIASNDPVLKPLQDWSKAALKQGTDTVVDLQGWGAEERVQLNGNINFFYTGPHRKALKGIDRRGFHVDEGYMQFGIADVPGLVIANSVRKTASRVPVAKNGFHLLKAQFWNHFHKFSGTAGEPTWHAVFGPEMAEQGRVSIVMSI